MPLLFDCSIEENIRVGNKDATNDEIIEAAKQANAHDFILKLPSGYKTNVGELGGRLSWTKTTNCNCKGNVNKTINIIIR